MASLFDTLQAGAYRNQIVPRSKDSMNWFRKKVGEIGNVSRTKVMSDPVLKKKANPDVGDMVMYVLYVKKIMSQKQNPPQKPRNSSRSCSQ